MANPTKFEAVYEKVEACWIELPIVRDNGRLQALPFIAVFLALYAVSGNLIWNAVLWLAADWERGAQLAVFLVSWVMFIFIGLIALMARSAQRVSDKAAQARNTGNEHK